MTDAPLRSQRSHFLQESDRKQPKKSPRAASSRSSSLLQRVSSIAATPVTQGCANEGAACLRFGVLHQLGHLRWIPGLLSVGDGGAPGPHSCVQPDPKAQTALEVGLEPIPDQSRAVPTCCRGFALVTCPMPVLGAPTPFLSWTFP